MSRRRNPAGGRAWWIAGLAGAAVLLGAGFAYASSKASGGGGPPPGPPGPTCVKQLGHAAEQLVVALNLGNVGPGIHDYDYNGQAVKFVNNMDGSLGNSDPDTPAGNTSIYVCS